MIKHKVKLVYFFRFFLAVLFVQWALATLPEFRQQYTYFLFKHNLSFLASVYKGVGVNVTQSSELSGLNFKYNALSMAAADGNLAVYEKLKKFGFNDKENLGKNTTPQSIILASFFSRPIKHKDIQDPELKSLV